MKTKIILSVTAFFLIICAFGQKSTIELTFTANYGAEYVQLDSINVTNETQGVDTVLYYPDTILVLDYGVGMPDDKNLGSGFRIDQNYPNPVTDQTTIVIYIPEEDNVSIMVTDIQGRQLLASEMNLISGNHSFRFMPGKGDMVFFTATWKGFTRYIKIIQSGSGYDKECKLAYSGYDGAGIEMKSQTVAMGFVFDLGDSLSYIGYATTPAGINGSDVKGDVPQNNETYIFEIIEGIPCPGIPMITYEGKHYKTVQIDAQCWMKENLNIGTRINGNQQQTDNGIIEKYCYDNDESNCDVYGGMYQWDETMQYVVTPGVQGICPTDWHIPTDSEWITLAASLGGASIAGGRMKETGTVHWASPNTGATNSSGFTALPGGYRELNGQFLELTESGSFWASNQDLITSAWCRYIYNNSVILYRWAYYKTYGWHVRCLKN